MATEIKLLEDTEVNFEISDMKSQTYGDRFDIKGKEGGLFSFCLGNKDTPFGLSRTEEHDDKTGQIKYGKVKLELEYGFEQDRDEQQKAHVAKFEEIRNYVADMIHKKGSLINTRTAKSYTRDEILDSIAPWGETKVGKKQKLNKTTNKMEYPLNSPKFKLQVPYKRIFQGREFKGQDETQLNELYDEETKQGTKLMRNENGKVIKNGLVVDSMQKTIPPRSTVKCYVQLAYIHVAPAKKGVREIFLTYQPIMIQRIAVQQSVGYFPNQVGGFSTQEEEADEVRQEEEVASASVPQIGTTMPPMGADLQNAVLGSDEEESEEDEDEE